ncbi:hypothetical protein GCM10011506_32100 [Marivirga lumbricoides]|uniref:Lipoprotein n=1 Tax=Marivirga lumbricoides TaxID=1046115 RepID=A0ABQ1MPQ9_9BACT|nr:hypothetical protein GCM10011506_32100 [Marivirga lumbricoides]
MRFFVIFILVVFTSCQKDTEAFLPTEKFNSIFDNPSEAVAYNPLDLIQTQDGGYLILASSNSQQIFVLKASSRGEFLWSKTMSSAYIQPIGNWIRNQENYYFVAQTISDRTAVLVEVDDLEQTLKPIREYTGYRRPLAFDYLNPNSYLLLTNNDTIGAVLSKIQEGFAMEWARAFDKITDTNAKLDNYLISNTPQFFVGAYNNGATLYFNTLRPEGFTFTFTDDQGIETGRIAPANQGSINSIATTSNGQGAFNYVANGQSLFSPQLTLRNNDSIFSSELNGELQPDRMSNKPALVLPIELSTTPYTLNAYTTVDGRIKLSLYSANSGELSAIEYIGDNDPLELAAIKATEDQGIVILSKTTIAGVRQRINLLKIPKEELVNLL